jgi:hypothetical protein
MTRDKLMDALIEKLNWLFRYYDREEKKFIALGTYEADLAAMAVFDICRRHTQVVMHCMKENPLLFPACTCARAAMESSVKAAWFAFPDEPMEREARFLLHLLEEEKALAQIAKIIPGHAKDAEQIRGFRLAVEAKLPSSVIRPKRMPTFEEMLNERGWEGAYAIYKKLCQFTHAGNHAVRILHGGSLGTMKQIGSEPSSYDWFFPIFTVFQCFFGPSQALIDRYNRVGAEGISSQFKEDVLRLMGQLSPKT